MRCGCTCAGGSWALDVALSFLILLGAISSGFEGRKDTGELEAGLGMVEDNTTFLQKTAFYCPHGQGGGGARVLLRVCSWVRKEGFKRYMKFIPARSTP